MTRIKRRLSTPSMLRGYLRLVFTIWPTRRNQRQHLAELDRRLLNDIGIEPAEAKWESRRPFWKGSTLR